MKHFTNKEKLLFITAMFTVSGLVVSNMNFIRDRFASNDKDAQFLLKKKLLAKALLLLDNKNQILEQADEYDRLLTQEGSDDSETMSFVEEVGRAAQSSSVRLLNVEQVSPRIIDVYKEYQLNIDTEGSIQGLTQFFYNLQNSPDLLRIVQFHIYSARSEIENHAVIPDTVSQEPLSEAPSLEDPAVEAAINTIDRPTDMMKAYVVISKIFFNDENAF